MSPRFQTVSSHVYGMKAFDASSGEGLYHKAAHGELLFKAADDSEPEGTIYGYGSKFGLVDSYGETVQKGAFKKSLASWRKSKRPIPMLWQHNSYQPIGAWHEYEEDETGLLLKGLINTETSRGHDAWSDVKAQAVGGLSIGYKEVRADPFVWEPTETPRRLFELDLREISVVTFPALKEAQIDKVKAALALGEPLTIRAFEQFIRDELKLSRKDAEFISRHGFAAWRQRDVSSSVNSELKGILDDFDLTPIKLSI